MPYKSFEDINPALKGIKPKITLAQANAIAKWADAMERAEDGPESAWAAAIAQFKKLYKSEGGKWVKKKQKESDYKGYTSTNNILSSVNAIDVDGEAVPVAELVAAYIGTFTNIDNSEDGLGNECGTPIEDGEIAENVSGSLEDYASRVRDAFRSAFGRRGSDGYVESPYVRDVFKDDSDLGNSVVIRDNGKMYAVDYVEGEDGFNFSDRGKWQEVMLTYKKVGMPATSEEIAEVELVESAVGHAIGLEETDKVANGPRAPLLMNVALIRPGFGNKKDNHYYPREVLKRDAGIFEGVKMYATDHRPDEKSVRTEVAVIRTCPAAFTDAGAPIARVAVHDGDFAEQARNRAQLGTLESLECSILGSGRVKKGEIDGQKANIVEAITKASSVDFVTKAGAGGHALNLAENDGGEIMSEQEKQEQEKVEETSEAQTEEVTLAEKQEQAQEEQAPQQLAEAEVAKLLSETNLPSTARKRLVQGEYEDESALREAILAEAEYIKALTGSGQPFAQGGRVQQQEETKPLDERLAEIDARYGLQVLQGQEV